MTTLTEGAIFDALRTVQEPELGRDIVSLNMVKGIAIDGQKVAFTIELTTPACPLKDEIEGNARNVLAAIGAETIEITWGAMVRRAAPQQPQQLLPGVKNVIAVASGKGGVGKSTVSVNLAVALAQAVPLGGAVLVTTPQEVSLSDVTKALAMFKRLSVPILGVVENMTAFICPHCGEATEIFGRGGGERFAAQHGIDFLGGVPLDITVRQGGDVGVPAVAQREPGPAARALTAVAGAVAARMSVRAAKADQQPVLSIS